MVTRARSSSKGTYSTGGVGVEKRCRAHGDELGDVGLREPRNADLHDVRGRGSSSGKQPLPLGAASEGELALLSPQRPASAALGEVPGGGVASQSANVGGDVRVGDRGQSSRGSWSLAVGQDLDRAGAIGTYVSQQVECGGSPLAELGGPAGADVVVVGKEVVQPGHHDVWVVALARSGHRH